MRVPSHLPEAHPSLIGALLLLLVSPGCATSSERLSSVPPGLTNPAGESTPGVPTRPQPQGPTASPVAPPPFGHQGGSHPAGSGAAEAPLLGVSGSGEAPIPAATRSYPQVPATATAIATVLARVEEALRDDATSAEDLPALGHQQQVLYRVLARQPQLAGQVRQALPRRWQPVLDQHLEARRAFLAMHPRRGGVSQVPAWRIRRPAPAAELLSLYRQAAATTGIPWEVLAAINLVESGMGRIDGVSVAGAQGPMQFLPSTWAEPGIGQGGNIRDPRDAIPAAARYLVRRGGLKDIRQALWGYNNSNHYGRGVLAYAALLRQDPAAYRGLYQWQVHLNSSGGDLWLPEGLELRRPEPVAEFLKRFPQSAPPAAAGSAPGLPVSGVPATAVQQRLAGR